MMKPIGTYLMLAVTAAVALTACDRSGAAVDNADAVPIQKAPAINADESFPITLDEPKLFGPFPFVRDGVPIEIYYDGQRSRNGKIDLTATNGFYNGFTGQGALPAIPTDAGLIPSSFKYLQKNSGNSDKKKKAQEDTTDTTDEDASSFKGARWHLYCPEAGEIKLSFFMKLNAKEAEFAWPVEVGTGATPAEKMPVETKLLHLVASDGESPQPQTLSFTVTKPGRVSVLFDLTKIPAEASASIAGIRCEGSAVEKTQLLRARFRPAAVHVAFSAPVECPNPTLWVFESRDISKNGGYSPLTTPFGYYGTSFQGGLVPAGASFNFSMWAASRDAKQAPPLDQMPRLIATDLPDASFGVFGGEGTGVKLRDARAYSAPANSAIQAMRVTINGGVPTYYGYFYDEPTHQWRLFCAGQKPAKRAGNSDANDRLARTGSFLEVPGPPGHQMSGDVIRTTSRRGWFYGSDGKFYPAIHGRESKSPDPATQSAAVGAPHPEAEKTTFTDVDKPVNQMFYKSADYDADGWMNMTMGGMEYYARAEEQAMMPAKAGLPEYLQPEKIAGLFHLPVVFGDAKASTLHTHDAVIDYPLKQTGPHSKAVLYFGPLDCITFKGNETGTLEKGTVTMQAMVSKDRTWQSKTPEQSVAVGLNQLRLSDLKENTIYFYRLYVEHDQGKSWDYVSGSFHTN